MKTQKSGNKANKKKRLLSSISYDDRLSIVENFTNLKQNNIHLNSIQREEQIKQEKICNKQLSNIADYQNNGDDTDEYFYDFEELREYNLVEKLNENNNKFSNSKFVKFLDPKEFDYKYIEKNGFDTPLVFREKTGLGLRVPSENFKVSDVKACVGSKRIIDVVDSNTQKALTMSMKDWCEYYEECDAKRERLLNVISLEFSHTKLENYVEAPLVVRQLDWIETAWPCYLRQMQNESTNLLEKMKYPKVQKYVLMSVKDCYTDFHIDMGGTSVWYHILKGEKVFWLIPPTEANLNNYIKWIKSGNQSRVFLPDIMDQCERIVLKQGWTFMLPSGWIHGVYTTKDSLVFGGNFLHSYNIEMQLKIYQIESRTKVPNQYRYPFYIEMIWFVIERYVHCLTGITHLKMRNDREDDEEHLEDDGTNCRHFAYKSFDPTNINLNEKELAGLKFLLNFLSNKNEVQLEKNIPKEICQWKLLYQSFRKILEKLELNDEKTNQTNGPFIHWPKPEKKYLKKILPYSSSPKKVDLKQKKTLNNSLPEEEPLSESTSTIQMHNSVSLTDQSFSSSTQAKSESRKHVMRNLPRTKGSIKKRLRPQNVPRSNVERRRRVRCHKCEPCTRDDCGECKYCKDMKKFGGTGISKQCCLSKQCLQPLLPTTTTCMLCGLLIDRNVHSSLNSVTTAISMFECEICFEIYHVNCFKTQYSNLNFMDSIVNEDLNNCWQCANCVNKGYIKDANSNTANTSQNNSLISSSFSHIISNNYSNNNNSTTNNNTSASNSLDTSFSSNCATYNNSKLQLTKINDGNKTKRQYNKKQKLNDQSEDCKKNLKERKKIISIESLTNFEKEIILREFCDILCSNEDNEEERVNENQQNQFKQDVHEEFDYDDDNIVYEITSFNPQQETNGDENEEDLKSFRSVSVINNNDNDSTSTQNSLSDTEAIEELENDFVYENLTPAAL